MANITLDQVIKQHQESKKKTSWWHIEGYILDLFQFVSRVPERISNDAYVKSTINLVVSMKKQVADHITTLTNSL